MGQKKDKKKKLAKKGGAVVTNKKQTAQQVQQLMAQKKKEQVTIVVDDKGTTAKLKLVGNDVICTDCISMNETCISSKKVSVTDISKLPHICSMCGVCEYTDEDKKREEAEIKEIKKKELKEHTEMMNGKGISTGVKGLNNLGNTCFFNSILQNLTHINALRDVLLVTPGQSPSVVKSTSSLTMEMHYFYLKMYKQPSTIVSPGSLLSEICKKSPRFRGFRQQDSHELLRYLLDGLISEEQTAIKSRRDPTYIDRIFGGRLISIITCFHCGNVSKTYEPFLDLSLPLPMAEKKVPVAQLSPLPINANRFTKLTALDEPESSLDDDYYDSIYGGDRPGKLSKSKLKRLKSKESKKNAKLEEEEKEVTSTGGDSKDDVSSPCGADGGGANSSSSPTAPLQEKENKPVEEVEMQDLNIIRPIFQEDYVSSHLEEAFIPSPPLSPVIESSTSPTTLSVGSNSTTEQSPFTNFKTSNDFVMLGGDTSFHQEQQLSTFNLIENYESDETPVSATLSAKSSSTVDKDFESLSITESLSPITISSQPSTPSTLTSSSTTTSTTRKQRQQQQQQEPDIQQEPIDLRQDIPKEAMMLDQLLACFMQFTNPEKLEGDNGFICSKCAKPNEKKKDQDKEKEKEVKEEEEEEDKDKIKVINDDLIKEILSEEPLSLEDEQEDDKKIKENGSSPNNNNNSSTESNSSKKKKQQQQQQKLKKKEDEEEEEPIRRSASKQYLLSTTPPYLTVHLKRFMQTRNGGLQKNGKHIHYPYHLDLTCFTDQSCPTTSKQSHAYVLNGVVEHMGGMGSGHYVAYPYDDQNDQWHYVSDSNHRPHTLHQVLTNEAYVLFYKKVDINQNDIMTQQQQPTNQPNNNEKKQDNDQKKDDKEIDLIKEEEKEVKEKTE